VTQQEPLNDMLLDVEVECEIVQCVGAGVEDTYQSRPITTQ
jgi:hypothetical protein